MIDGDKKLLKDVGLQIETENALGNSIGMSWLMKCLKNTLAPESYISIGYNLQHLPIFQNLLAWSAKASEPVIHPSNHRQVLQLDNIGHWRPFGNLLHGICLWPFGSMILLNIVFFKTTAMSNYPKCSMYGIFTNIYLKNHLEM